MLVAVHVCRCTGAVVTEGAGSVLTTGGGGGGAVATGVVAVVEAQAAIVRIIRTAIRFFMFLLCKCFSFCFEPKR